MRRSSSFVFPQQQENDEMEDTLLGSKSSGRFGTRLPNNVPSIRDPAMFAKPADDEPPKTSPKPMASPHWNAVKQDLNQLNSDDDDTTASKYNACSSSLLKRGQQKPNLSAFPVVTSNASSRPLLSRAQERPVHVSSLEKPVHREIKPSRPAPYWASIHQNLNSRIEETEASSPSDDEFFSGPLLNRYEDEAFEVEPESELERPASYRSGIDQKSKSDHFVQATPADEEKHTPRLSTMDHDIETTIAKSNFPSNIDPFTQTAISSEEEKPHATTIQAKQLESAKSLNPSDKQTGFTKRRSSRSPLHNRDPFAKPVLAKSPAAEDDSEEVQASALTKPNTFAKPVLGRPCAHVSDTELLPTTSLRNGDPFAKPVLGKPVQAGPNGEMVQPLSKLTPLGDSKKDKSNKKEITRLNKRIEEYEEQIKTLQDQLEEVTLVNEEYLHCITRLNEETQNEGQSMADHLGQENASLKRKVQELEQDHEFLINAEEELNAQAKALGDAQCQNHKLGLELERLKGLLDEYEKENVISVSKINELTEIEAEMAMKNENLMLTEKMLMATVRDLEEDLRDLKAENEEASEEMRRVKDNEEKTLQENVMLKTRIDELEDTLKNKENNSSIMEAIKKNEELKRRIAEIDKEKAEIEAKNNKYTTRLETLAEMEQKTERDVDIEDVEIHLQEVRTALEFVNEDSSSETPASAHQASEEDVDLQKTNEELKTKVKELELKLRLSDSANEELKTSEHDESTSKEMICVEEVMQQLRNLQNIILDAKRELKDVSDSSSVTRSSHSSLSDELSQADEEYKASKPLPKEKDQRYELESIFKALTNTAEDLIDEIVKTRNREEKSSHSDSSSISEERQKISKLQDELRDLEDEIKEIKDDLDYENDKCKELEKSVNEKEQRNNELSEINEQLKKDLAEIKNKLEKSTSGRDDQLNQLKIDLKNKTAQLEELQGELQDTKNGEIDWNDALQAARSESAAKDMKVTELKVYIDELESENARLLEEMKDQRNTYLSVQEERDEELQNKINELQQEISDVQTDKDKLEKELKKVNTVEMQYQMDALRSETDLEKQKMVDHIAALKVEINKIERMLTETREQASSDKKKYESDVEMLKKEIQSLHDTAAGHKKQQARALTTTKKAAVKGLVQMSEDLLSKMMCDALSLQIPNKNAASVDNKDLEKQKMVDHIAALEIEINKTERMLTETREQASSDKKKYESDVEMLKKEIQTLHDAAAEHKKDLEESDNDLTAAKGSAVKSLELLSEDLLGKIEMYDALSLQIQNDNTMAEDNNDSTSPSLGVQIENTIIFLENANSQLRNKLSNSERQLKKMMENRDVPDNDAKAENDNTKEKQISQPALSKDSYKTTQELERLKVASKKLEGSLEKTSKELKNIQDERSTLQKDLKDLKLKHTKLETEFKHAVAFESSLKERNMVLKDQVETLNKDLASRDTELQTLKKSKENHSAVESNNVTEPLEKKLKDLALDNEMMLVKEKQLQQYNKQLESVVVSSRGTVNELKQKVSKLESAQKEWEEKENRLQNEIQTSAAKIKDLQTKLSENIKTKESLEKQIATIQGSVPSSEVDAKMFAEIKAQLNTLQKESQLKSELMGEKQKEIMALTSQRKNSLKQFKQKSIQVAKLESALKEKRDVEKKLSDQVQALEKSESEMKEHLEEMKSQKFLLSKQLEVAEEMSTREKNISMDNTSEQQEKINLLECDKVKLYEQEQQLKSSIENLEKINSCLITEKEELTKQLEEAKQASERRLRSYEDQLKESEASLEKGLKVLEEKLSTKTSEVTNLIQQSDKLKAHIKELEKEVLLSKEQIDLLERKLSQTETDKDHWEEKEMKLEGENVSLLEKIGILKDQVAQIDIEAKNKNKEGRLVEETHPLDSKVCGMMKEKEKLLEKVENLEKQLAEKKTYEQKQMEAEEEVISLRKKIEHLQVQLDEQTTKEEDYTKQQLMFKETITKLKESIVQLKSEKEVLECNYKDVRSSLQSRIKELKLTVSEHVASNELLQDNEAQIKIKIDKLQMNVRSLTEEKERQSLKESSQDELVSAKEAEIKSITEKYSTAEKDWNKHKTELENTLHDLQERFEVLKDGKEVLMRKCENEKSFFESEIKELKTCNADYKKESDKWRQTEHQLVEKIDELKERNTTLADKIDKLQMNVRSLTDDKERQSLKENSHGELVSAKEAEIKSISEKYSTAKKEWNKHKTELENTLHDLQECFEVLKDGKEVLMLKCESEKSSLESEIKELKTCTADHKKEKEKWSQVEHQLEEKINELKERNTTLMDKNEQLSREHTKQLESSQRRLLEEKNETSEIYRREQQKLEKQIRELQDRISSLTKDNELLSYKNKDQLHSSERQMLEIEQKMVEQCKRSREEVLSLEGEIKVLQGRIETLTADNSKLNVKIKEQQESVDKNDRLRKSLKESATSCELELGDLKERLQESKDSERKLNNTIERMKIKLSKLNDEKESLGKEKDYLFNKVRNHKYQMKAYADYNKKMKGKLRSFAQELSTMKSERRQLNHEIFRMIKKLQLKDDFSVSSDQAEMSLGDELNFSLKKMMSFDEYEDDCDSLSSLSTGCKPDSWRNEMTTIPEDDFEMESEEIGETDIKFVNLTRSLQKLKSTMDAALQRTRHEEQETQELKKRSKKVIRALEEKVMKIEEENDVLQREMQQSSEVLKETKKGALAMHTRSLEIEKQAATLIDSWKNDMLKIQKQKQSIKMQLKEVSASNVELEKLLEEKETTEKRLKDKVASLEINGEEFTKTAEQNEMQLNESLRKLKAQIHKLEKDLKAKESIEGELSNDVQRLENDLEMKEKRILEHRKAEIVLAQQLKKAEETVSLLEETKSMTQQALDDMKTDKENIEQIMTRKLENERQEKKDILASKDDLLRTLDGLRAQLAKVERERKDMERENLTTIQSLREELDAKTNDGRIALECEKRKSKVLEERLSASMSEQKQGLNDEIEDLKASVSRQTDELDRKSSANKELKEKLRKLQTDFSHLKERKQYWKEEYGRLERKTRPASKDNTMHDKCRHEQQMLQDKVYNLKKEITRLEDRKKDENDNKKDQIRNLKYELSTAENTINDLQRQLKSCAQKEQTCFEELVVVKGDRDNLDEAVRRLQNKNRELTMEIDALKCQVDELRHRMNANANESVHRWQDMFYAALRPGTRCVGSRDGVHSANMTHSADSMSHNATGHGGQNH